MKSLPTKQPPIMTTKRILKLHRCSSCFCKGIIDFSYHGIDRHDVVVTHLIILFANRFHD